ncbi:aspartate/glutamate racemase family protein [Microbacterium sp.]|uniref:aspartate/glutamate racemase family protein n=1 Tax=Microbacterium sp. TaxID=51671 RepID=UPI0039E306E6
MPDRPHILIVNPNTTVATTSAMTALAAAALDGTNLIARGTTVDAGPSVITTPEELSASIPHVVDRVGRSVTAATRAIIVAAIGDPGVDELRALSPLPVIGLGEASVREAVSLERPFGMATSTPALAPGLLALVSRYAPTGTFTGVRVTGSSAQELAGDEELERRELHRTVGLCVQDGAEAVIIGGGPLSRSAARLSGPAMPQIIQPVPSAVSRVLALIGLTAVGAP